MFNISLKRKKKLAVKVLKIVAVYFIVGSLFMTAFHVWLGIVEPCSEYLKSISVCDDLPISLLKVPFRGEFWLGLVVWPYLAIATFKNFL